MTYNIYVSNKGENKLMKFRLKKIENSSNVDRVGYNGYNGDLYVTFKSGHSYIYHGVLEEVFEDLLVANSVGRFINTEIKPHHTYEKLPDNLEVLLDNIRLD